MTDVNRDLQRLTQDAYGVTYADPLDPNFTIRFKNTRANKSLNGVTTTNHVTEIIVNDDQQITISGVNATDALSIRVRVSGAFESTARKSQMLKSLGLQLVGWANENVLVGFEPTSTPRNTVSS